MEFIKNSKYYNKPEGQDYVGKMVATNKWTVGLTLPLATADVLMYSHPKGTLAIMARYFQYFAPALGLASFFTTGTYLACQIRGKDDK
jgi:NADH dehydrogenase (ubiquinone) 1 alpha subcomplex subunit 11